MPLDFSTWSQDITVVGHKSKWQCVHLAVKTLLSIRVIVRYGIEGAVRCSPSSVTQSQRESLHVTHPVSCSEETGHRLPLQLWGACCCITAPIACAVPGSKCIWGWASLISSSHASDWFVLLIDSCDNEVIVRRQSVHRNVFVSCGLGSWAFCVPRGSSWLGQSKGQNMKWLTVQEKSLLLSRLCIRWLVCHSPCRAVCCSIKTEFSKPFYVPLEWKYQGSKACPSMN